MKEKSIVKGNLVSARRGVHTQYEEQFVVKADGCKTKAAASGLVGKRVVLPLTKRKKYSGKVTSTHGASGAVIATFASGLPGQFLGKTVEIG